MVKRRFVNVDMLALNIFCHVKRVAQLRKNRNTSALVELVHESLESSAGYTVPYNNQDGRREQ